MGAFDSTLGFLLSGVLVATFMFGLVTLQTYTYFRTFPRDGAVLKSLVSF